MSHVGNVAALEARHWTRILGAVLAGALVLRLAALLLNRTDLFFDEAQYWSWSRELAAGYYSKPPLIAWIIAGATAVCGHGEACVRAAAPVLHTMTAALVFLIGRRLYDEAVGFWAAVAFLTLPGVSLSSSLISTDVPLLVCWAAALLAFIILIEEPGWRAVPWLGFAIGFGLNAKYAMAYFVACALVYLAATPIRRGLLGDARLWSALGLGVLCLAPNIAWNVTNSFATFGHTADNAKWGGALFHPGKMLEFFGSQFGVMGPILFSALLLAAWCRWREGGPEADRLLLFFSLPIVAVITVQALLSRAHANWAATAYVAGTLVTVAWLLRTHRRAWLGASTALHVAIAVVLVAALALAGRIALPAGNGSVARLLGWRDVAGAVAGELERARLSQQPYRAVLTDDRSLTATLIYYLRDVDVPVLAWREPGRRPADHYELSRAVTPHTPMPVLLVSGRERTPAALAAFETAGPPRTVAVPAGPGNQRILKLYALKGRRGR